jgi:hypothetical protein
MPLATGKHGRLAPLVNGSRRCRDLLELPIGRNRSSRTYYIMRPLSCRADELRALLLRNQMATLDELKHALGTSVDVTVFRKLRPLGYLSRLKAIGPNQDSVRSRQSNATIAVQWAEAQRRRRSSSRSKQGDTGIYRGRGDGKTPGQPESLSVRTALVAVPTSPARARCFRTQHLQGFSHRSETVRLTPPLRRSRSP